MRSVCILIYVSISLSIYTRYIWTGSTRWLSAIRGAPEDDDQVKSEIHCEAVIERVWRCTWRSRWSELRDALGGCDRASWRCTWRPRLSELTDALGGHDRASLEMQLETETEWTQRCTGRPWSSEFGDGIGDRDWVNSEIHSEAVIERVWRCTCSRLWSSEIGGVLGGGRSGGGRWEARQVLRLYSLVT